MNDSISRQLCFFGFTQTTVTVNTVLYMRNVLTHLTLTQLHTLVKSSYIRQFASSAFTCSIACADSFTQGGSSGGSERAALLVLRDGGPFEAGIKGDGSTPGAYKKGLHPTHFVLCGGIQEQVFYNLLNTNDDGLYNRVMIVPCLPTYQSLRE